MDSNKHILFYAYTTGLEKTDPFKKDEISSSLGIIIANKNGKNIALKLFSRKNYYQIK